MMKKLFTLLMLTMSLAAWGAVGDEFSVDNCKFKVTAEPASSGAYGEATCTGLSTTGAGTSQLQLTIPHIVTNGSSKYYVKVIGENAFQNKTNIRILRLIYGIQDIKASAFQGCTGITSLRLPSSIQYLRSQCFDGCNNISSVYYAGDARSITTYNSSFTSSSSRYLYVPYCTDKADVRNKQAFSSSNFPTIRYSSNAYDFYMTDGTMFVVTKPSTSTSTPHECTIIGFNENGGQVENGRFYPGDAANPAAADRRFRYTAISDSAFMNNTSLKELDLSRATYIETLGRSAVQGCTNLTSVNLGNVNIICNSAFADCKALTILNIPASTSSIVYTSFVDGCSALQKIAVDDANLTYSTYSMSLFSKDKTYLFRVPPGYIYSNMAFPATLKYVTAYAFSDVTALTELSFPFGFETLEREAVMGCTNLKRVFLPSTVKSIEDYSFSHCTKLEDFYINLKTPPTINKSTVFRQVTTANVKMHVPFPSLSTQYEAAGWTGFKSYNENYVASRDYNNGTLDYTITSTTPVKVNNANWDGTARVVRSAAYATVNGATNIPSYIQINGKRYAVTEIGQSAFGTTNEFSITGCKNIDIVDVEAFYETPITSIELPYVSIIYDFAFYKCNKLKNVIWAHRLKEMHTSAFYGCTSFGQNVRLPVGFDKLYNSVFNGTKVKKILVPSTLTRKDSGAFDGMSSLTDLIYNCPSGPTSIDYFTFDNVPTSCKVYVPVGYKAIAKANSGWSRFSSINEGAFDFAAGDLLESTHTMTVTSTTPVTLAGVTYDGKAKYVYNSLVKDITDFAVENYETNWFDGYSRKYLMTEIGDSCFAQSKITSIDLSKMEAFEQRIGKKAFYGSKLQSIEFNNPVSFGRDAFTNATDLKEIVCYSSFDYDGKFFGNNAADFTMYVDHGKLYNTINGNLKNYTYKGAQTCDIRVSSWIKPSYTTFSLGAIVPLDFSGCEYNVYTANQAANVATGIIPSTKLTTVNSGYGIILTDLSNFHIYKLKRQFNNNTSSPTYHKAVNQASSLDLNTVNNSYYWQEKDKKFIKVTDTYNAGSGRGYLVMPGGASELYLDIFAPASKTGDVNGDGTVDVADVNLTINIMLGKTNKSSYPGADVNHDNTVDIADVNAILNIMLGK